MPGPGQYNVDRRTAPRAGSGPTSSFRCTRTPLDVGSHLQSPAPGTYELQQTPQTRVDKNGQVLKDSVFRSRTKRTFLATNDVPGPGEYDVEHGVAVEKDSMRGSGAVGAKDAGTGVGRSRSQPEPSSGRSKEDEEATPGNHISHSRESILRVIRHSFGSRCPCVRRSRESFCLLPMFPFYRLEDDSVQRNFSFRCGCSFSSPILSYPIPIPVSARYFPSGCLRHMRARFLTIVVSSPYNFDTARRTPHEASKLYDSKTEA